MLASRKSIDAPLKLEVPVAENGRRYPAGRRALQTVLRGMDVLAVSGCNRARWTLGVAVVGRVPARCYALLDYSQSLLNGSYLNLGLRSDSRRVTSLVSVLGGRQ